MNVTYSFHSYCLIVSQEEATHMIFLTQKWWWDTNHARYLGTIKIIIFL